MRWTIEFYKSEDGEDPIVDFIKKTYKTSVNEIETAKKRLADYRKRCL